MGKCLAETAERIAWSAIDRGLLPSPDLGPSFDDVGFNDERRFRALCVEHLRAEPNHTFRFSEVLVAEINARMDRLPEWKRATFSERYFQADEEFLSDSLFECGSACGSHL